MDSLKIAQVLWRTEPGAVLAAEVGRLRLVVEAKVGAGGEARFVVQRRQDETGSGTLIGSGFRVTVGDAMRAAEQMADRLTP